MNLIRLKKTIQQVDEKNQKYNFLYKYIVKKGNRSYKFTGYSCCIEPCFQFEQDGEVENYFFDRFGWALAKEGRNEIMINDIHFDRPKKFLAPEICELVKGYNDHILKELKYLSWKVFGNGRKSKEFLLINLCFQRVNVRLPPEMVFYILSFVKGYELNFGVEEIDIEPKNIRNKFQFNIEDFPVLRETDQKR